MRLPDRLHQESATLSAGDAWRALAYACGLGEAPGSVDAYREAWSALSGGPAVPVSSARGAIALALRASGIGARHEVIVAGFTCVAVPAAVLAASARPVYADVDAATGNITPDTVLAVRTPRTRAVIVQHTFGNPAPTSAIRAALPADVVVIEDAVHALGSTLEGRPVGRDGDWTVFGTEHSKGLSTGQGGVLAAVSPRAISELRALDGLPTWPRSRTRRWCARVALDRLVWVPERLWGRRGSTAAARVLRHALGRVSSRDAGELTGKVPAWRIAELPAELAEIGLRQLNRLESILSHRRRLAVTYAALLAEAASRGTLDLLASLPGADPVWLRYPLLVDGAETVISIMRRRGWDLAPRWFSQPVYPPGTDLAAVGYQAGACPGGETLAARVLNLPTHPLIKRELGIRLVEDLLRVVR